MELISGKIGDANYHLFDEVLEQVYEPYPHNKTFVQKVNPYAASEYYVVLKDGEPVARCIVYKNDAMIFENESPLVFGNFECINNKSVAQLLFSIIEKKGEGKNIIGPISGSTWYDYRIALPSQNPIFFTEFYTPPYYKELLSAIGFNCLQSFKSTHALSYEVNEKKLLQCEKLFHDKNIHIRNLDLLNFEKDLDHIFQVSLAGFKNNFLYSPISREEFMAKYLPLKPIANPSTIFLAFDGEICVGFSMCLLNLYNKEKKQLVMKSAARLPAFRYNGLGTYFNELIKKGAKESGYEELIVAFLIDDGVSENTFSSANDNVSYREYELLIKRKSA